MKKTRITKSIVATMMLSFLFVFCMQAQDADRQKIIEVIQGELESFSNKERSRWESYWSHSDAVRRFTVASGLYSEVFGWDSLRRAADPYFQSTDNGYKATKTSFDIRVAGSMAIVHLDEISEDKSTIKETVILERQALDWKILEMYVISKSSFDTSDASIEAALNTQGYNLLFRSKFQEAVKVFTLNTEFFPSAYNTWDSLAEGYLKLGDTNKAIEYYQKSLNLNPRNDNARKYLAQLKK